MRPKEHFDLNPKDLEEVVQVVRKGFGRPEMDFQDIYRHVTNPEEVYFLRNGGIKAMASYSRQVFTGHKTLLVEGVAMAPEVQGKGVFGDITNRILSANELICLRTQNPCMYRALEKICKEVYPNGRYNTPKIDEFRKAVAEHLKCEIEGEGIIRGYYGSLFYGIEPFHKIYSDFFKEKLGMRLNEGDAVLLLGFPKKFGAFAPEEYDIAMGMI